MADHSAKKRTYTREQKLAMLAEVDAAKGERGAASRVAREHGIDPSLLSAWRAKLLKGASVQAPAADVPQVTHSDPAPAAPQTPPRGFGLARAQPAEHTGGDPVLGALWLHAEALPDMRDRFRFVAEAWGRYGQA